jgi:hypothetical protein
MLSSFVWNIRYLTCTIIELANTMKYACFGFFSFLSFFLFLFFYFVQKINLYFKGTPGLLCCCSASYHRWAFMIYIWNSYDRGGEKLNAYFKNGSKILHKTLVYCVLKKCIVFEKTQIFRFLIKKLLL